MMGRVTLKRMQILCSLFLLCFTMTGAAVGADLTYEDAQDVYAAGNAFYRDGQYQEAAQAYGEVVDSGFGSAPAFYNLGTAEARVGSNTLALAHLMKARKLDPRSDDVRANLKFVTDTIAQRQLPGTASVSAQSVWSRVYGWMRAEEWLLVLWCVLMVAAAGVATVLLSRSTQLKAVGRGVAVAAGLACLLIAVPTAAQVYASKLKKQAMIVTTASMLSGPAERFTRVQALAEGQMVRLLGHEDAGYVRVATEDGRNGYVRREFLVEI